MRFTEISQERAAGIARRSRITGGLKSAVGHVKTAAIFSKLLGEEVEFNRTTVELRKGDVALLGQYSGPRLPEGETSLPEGARIRWFIVEVASVIVEAAT
ncbi:DUF1874 domain-containing protein [Stenotrophomonas sp.]|uniref:STIV orfB116 family protein n=1 Tax=Stenotrophomonas sp. TaxID=69392 RepID=UPI0019C059BC|nr:DUF1874 domain-containing protein [Stenotrophomonas sp.]MBD3828840.1 DUF1874 domain-containing protein [Stenotrophomonas sp.]